MKNLFLCGFMGCGKSTVGVELAKSLKLPCVDMDTYIEKRHKMIIKDMFAKYGESYFRALEHCACLELSRLNGSVISLGGGTVTVPENVKVLKSKNCELIFIDTSLEVIKERLNGDTTRPLLQRPDRERAIEDLYNKRYPTYKKSATIIVNGDDTPENISKYIAARL